MNGKPAIVIYDADCLICSGAMRFLARRDGEGGMRFSGLQKVFPGGEYESVLYWDGSMLHQKSQAVIQILGRLGGGFRRLGLLLDLLPTGVMDFVYDFIARRRHLILRSDGACEVPEPDFLKRILTAEEIECLRLSVTRQDLSRRC